MSPPLAHPIASSSSSLKPAAEQALTTVKGADSLLLRGAAPMSGRVSARGLAELYRELSDRDSRILREVAEHRYLDAKQVEALCYSDRPGQSARTRARACRRTLERLSRDRVLVRLERRVGGVRAGSASYIYALGPVGYRLLGLTRRPRREPSTRFLEHTLAVAQAHISLVEADRTGWLELVSVDLEPGCWRRYGHFGAERQTLRPDLYVVTAAGELEHCWFIEIDLATEHPSTVVRKCWEYQRYRESGTEQERSGTFPRVTWSTPSTRRGDQLRAAIGKAHNLNPEPFTVVTYDDLAAELAARADRTLTNQPAKGGNDGTSPVGGR